MFSIFPMISMNIDSSTLKLIFFACLFSVHNTISLSRHEQAYLIRLRFEA